MASRTLISDRTVTIDLASETTVVLEGQFRQDGFGRIVVDQCESDEDHLKNATTDLDKNKPYCRFLVEEFFENITGRKGSLVMKLSFLEDLSHVRRKRQNPETS